MGAVLDAPPADFSFVLTHESGHLIAAHRIGLLVKKIEITVEGERVDGYSHIDLDGGRLVDQLAVLLAGEETEQQVFGRHVLPRVHANSDRSRLYLEVVRAGPQGQQALVIARQKIAKLVRVHRRSIIRLANELLALATDAGVAVEGQQLDELLDADGSAILRRAAV